MNKAKTLKRLKRGHECFRRMAGRLNDHQIVTDKVLGHWTTQDIIAHLSAWNWEQAKAVDDLLADRKPLWWGLDADDFNREEVEKRKDLNLEKILQEWEQSFEKLIARVGTLSEKEWTHEACEKGGDGLLVNVDSMLAYEYEGKDHEGGHAKQLEKSLRTKK